MTIDRRSLLAGAAVLPGLATPAAAQSVAPQGLDAALFGVHAGSPDDQTRSLQRAIEQTAQRRLPLWLAPGMYRTATLNLPAGAQLTGVRSATRLVSIKSAPLLNAQHGDNVTLSALTFDGNKIPLPESSALLMLSNGRDVHVNDCQVVNAGGNGILCRSAQGQLTNTAVLDAADTAIFSIDGINMLIAGNTIQRAGNGGIRVWQSEKRTDGAIVVDNQIEDTRAVSGGSGQNGNAINVFRAANVIVRGNRIRNAAFSAVRGNAASQIQIIGNNCSGLGEVALYSEFDFEGAAITGNIVDGAGMGVSVTNFKEGGRLATVQGNVLRNITTPRPASDPGEGFGIGIGVEADTAVTGNVIENAAKIGIVVGNGPYLRDCSVTGNVVRGAPYGIAVSVAQGAGAAVIARNVITGARRGAVVGTEWEKIVTADLVLIAPGAYPQLTITANQVR